MVRRSPPRVVVATVVVAWVLTVGAQVAAAVWGARGQEPVPPAPTRVERPEGCGDETCRVLASTVVNGMSVELLADSRGDAGRLRAGGPVSGTVTTTRITGDGVRLNHDSLRCAASATPVCLVRGPRDGGMAGEVHVWRGDSWEAVGEVYFSDLGVLVLDDVVGTAMPEVLVARETCTDRDGSCRELRAVAEVLTLDGARAGCTRARRSPGELPGWPDVEVGRTDLTTCPDGLDPR
ncbi:hypothetical protein B1813_17265 [Saccharomonospora piscinae]|uniref:Uncharacterized protein n=1 Tax=Saccharomonospora piscinae TaxID=687388 RepID=A0A1V8ZZH9_SACPI|nr:hypothetical protein [Saccharomonospora piscinae]OQO90191.1 hypothetical protein B1813_17265 [Saccharomonospora piscinae]